MTNLMGLYSEVGAYIWEEKHFDLKSVSLIFFSFFQYQARISAFFTSLKVSNKDTRIRKVNVKVKNKDTVDVVLFFLLLTLNAFYFFLERFYC